MAAPIFLDLFVAMLIYVPVVQIGTQFALCR